MAVVAAAVRAAAADDRAEKRGVLVRTPFFIAQRLRKKEKQLAFSSRLCYNTNRLLLMWHVVAHILGKDEVVSSSLTISSTPE